MEDQTIKIYHLPSKTEVSDFRKWLHPEEIARANRFVFDSDRNQFILCRGALRLILSNYLACEPNNIHFEYGPRGKPKLSSLHHNKDIEFNLSHTKDYALIAVARSICLGIDIEYDRCIPNLDSLMRNMLSQNEIDYIRLLPAEERCSAFLRYWTGKEAILKCLGLGIGDSISEYDIEKWTILNISHIHPYIAALAYEGKNLSIEHLYSIL